MTSPTQPDDRHEALFIADFYPRLGEYLAQRHASGYDAVAARARFLLWLAVNVEGPRIPVHTAEAITEIVKAQRRLARELGREPTPEELAAEFGTRPEEAGP